jgi:hypothetical protein
MHELARYERRAKRRACRIQDSLSLFRPRFRGDFANLAAINGSSSLTGITRWTFALVSVIGQLYAGPVAARFRGAGVNSEAAVGLLVAVSALALVTGEAVDANATLGAGDAHALVDVRFAELALEAWLTLAGEVPPGLASKDAAPVVGAGLGGAGVVLPLAVLADEVPGAVARVAVGPVDAGAAVLAGLRLTLVHVYLAVLTYWDNRAADYCLS